MNKMNLFFGVLILSTIFLFGCSSSNAEPDTNHSSSSFNTPSSSSSGPLVLEDQKLVRKNITLSLDSSYADIDGDPSVYVEADAANNLDKIDLVAYCGTDMGCKSNSIYSPREIDLFWNPTYIGSRIYLFEIPPEQSEIFKTATRLYDILQPYNNLISAGIIGGVSLKEISIVEDKVFYISTSEKKASFVIIKQIGEQSVNLEILGTPIPGSD